MYARPTGPQLSPEEANQLDTQYLASHPTGYFRSRIYELLAAYQRRDEPQEAIDGFTRVLGAVAPSLTAPTPDEIELQVATDAVQLRHHAAEALLRLLHSRMSLREKQSQSLWLEMTESPTQMKDVVSALDSFLTGEDPLPVLAGLLFPIPIGTVVDPKEFIKPIEHALAWIERAMLLVSREHIDLAAASHKIRHGATTTAYNDRRVLFTKERPDRRGKIPLEALQPPNSLDVVNNPVVEYISRPPKSAGRSHGHERTILNADVEETLAEAWLLALIHGALFYCAAYRHHGEDASKVQTPQPPWAIGPSPVQLIRGRPLGFRFPLTTAPDGTLSRPSGLADWQGNFREMSFGPPTSGVVTD